MFKVSASGLSRPGMGGIGEFVGVLIGLKLGVNNDGRSHVRLEVRLRAGEPSDEMECSIIQMSCRIVDEVVGLG